MVYVTNTLSRLKYIYPRSSLPPSSSISILNIDTTSLFIFFFLFDLGKQIPLFLSLCGGGRSFELSKCGRETTTASSICLYNFKVNIKRSCNKYTHTYICMTFVRGGVISLAGRIAEYLVRKEMQIFYIYFFLLLRSLLCVAI